MVLTRLVDSVVTDPQDDDLNSGKKRDLKTDADKSDNTENKLQCQDPAAPPSPALCQPPPVTSRGHHLPWLQPLHTCGLIPVFSSHRR